MFRAHQRREGMSIAIFGLWRNWAIAVGLLTLLASMAPIVPAQWLAPVNLLFYVMLQWYKAELCQRQVPSCTRLIHEISSVMIVTGVVLVIIYLTVRRHSFYAPTGQEFTLETPVLGILITAPVATLVTLRNLMRKRHVKVCRNCHYIYGNVIEHGFAGMLYSKEWRYQTRLLFLLSLLISIVDWLYYMGNYTNINLDQSDRFFFVWLPMAMYAASLIFLGIKYYTLWVVYCQNDEAHWVEHPGESTMRYIILHDDKVFISLPKTGKQPLDEMPHDDLYDTPVIITTHYHEREDIITADREFKHITGITNVEIKRFYSSLDEVTYHNIFHYFAFVDSPADIARFAPEGKWVSWANLCQLSTDSKLYRDFAAEFARAYKIAMAWKTYDSNGRRRYPVKHYYPSFKLRKIREWDVDFNDSTWLNVADFNEDSFGYRVRKLFPHTLHV
jgi:hypothetical protein